MLSVGRFSSLSTPSSRSGVKFQFSEADIAMRQEHRLYQLGLALRSRNCLRGLGLPGATRLRVFVS